MLGGRAAIINQATRKQRYDQKNKMNRRDQDMVAKYGLERVPDDQLKRYKPQPRKEQGPTDEQLAREAQAAERRAATGEYDHHAEILKAKQEMEEKERANQDSDEETGSINVIDQAKNNIDMNT